LRAIAHGGVPDSRRRRRRISRDHQTGPGHFLGAELDDPSAQGSQGPFRLGPRPKFDRFAYWEKFDYWGVFWGMAVIGFSGYAMWFAPFFAKFFPGSWLNVALLIHGEEALLAAWFIFAVHFFNTHLRPGSFPMDLVIFTGRETEKELKERHPEEYQRLLEKGQLQAAQADAPPQWLKIFGRLIGVIVISSGFVLLCLTLVAFFRGE
jgi:hypothetical protein